MMSKFLAFLFFVIIHISANAQFNDSIHHYVRFGTTGAINKTDVSRSYLFSNSLRYNLRKKNKSVNFNGSYIYGEQNKLLTNNDFSSTLDFNLFPKDSSKLYYWGLLNFDKSYSLRINSRVQTGLGAAYNFFDNTVRFLNISEGVLYEASDLKINDSTNQKYSIARNSLRLRYRFVLWKLLVIDGANFLQNSLADKNDYIIKLTNNASFKIRSWLSFTTSVNYNRNNITARENLLFTFGFSAEKYF